eukprot:TRINITY_DN8078_c0_g1_i1.p1 TRINITY_DN8078_c0_g1~~TRINITY_DN8078_c0_g1_i1.p1  ORF type:complete len:300 (-),score=51.09 TRINITY_DN8078_c0_g1_i1:47-862(-)
MDTSSTLEPQAQPQALKKPFLSFPIWRSQMVELGSPLFGLLLCLFVAVTLHFEGVNETHCRVKNWMPSISATTGDYLTERFIWRFMIGIMSTVRLFDGLLHYFFYQTKKHLGGHLKPWLNVFVFIAHVTANLSLLTLTYISSTEYRVVHENAFVVFMVFSAFHMVGQISLHYSWAGKPSLLDTKNKQSQALRWKIFWFFSTHFLFFTGLYFYFRHNKFCEPYVYSIFACFEWGAVISNIMFQCGSFLDFADIQIWFVEVSKEHKDKNSICD